MTGTERFHLPCLPAGGLHADYGFGDLPVRKWLPFPHKAVPTGPGRCYCGAAETQKAGLRPGVGSRHLPVAQ